jgi:hypothetical protein
VLQKDITKKKDVYKCVGLLIFLHVFRLNIQFVQNDQSARKKEKKQSKKTEVYKKNLKHMRSTCL